MQNPRVRAVLLFLLVLTFGVLLFGGQLINKEKPPIPEAVRTPTGEQVFGGRDVRDGQDYYFSRGGQHIGTIWGHGSYLAPDWSADFLHRMGLFLAAGHREDRGTGTAGDELLRLAGLGGRNSPPGQGLHVHEQLAL
jgi:nitric oxide reductase subunit B